MKRAPLARPHPTSGSSPTPPEGEAVADTPVADVPAAAAPSEFTDAITALENLDLGDGSDAEPEQPGEATAGE